MQQFRDEKEQEHASGRKNKEQDAEKKRLAREAKEAAKMKVNEESIKKGSQRIGPLG